MQKQKVQRGPRLPHGPFLPAPGNRSRVENEERFSALLEMTTIGK